MKLNIKSFGMAVLIVLILVTVARAKAQGGPPMLTDDPDTPGDKNWEINTAFIESDTQSEKARDFPRIDFNYGLGDRIQLKYEIGWHSVQPTGQSWQSGLDNSLIGIKWRFVGAEDADFKVSVYPQYEFENGTNSVERGIADPGPNFLLPIEVSRSFGQVAVVAEAGHEFLHDANDEWVYGLLGALQPSDNLELMAELHGTAESGSSNPDSLVNVGLRERLSDHLKLLASVGTGLASGPDSTRLVAYLGIQLLLGQNSHDAGMPER